MDKVKAFFSALGRHHYWLLAVVVIVLPIIAWRSMAQAKSTEIEARRGRITAAENMLEKIAGPNENWIEGATKINELNEAQQQESVDKLFRSQQIQLKWPDSVASRVEESGLKYRQQFNDLEIRKHFPGTLGRVGGRQSDGYRKLLTDLAQSLEPYDEFTKTGNVILKQDDVLELYPGAAEWEDNNAMPPTDQQIWDALEDVALQTSIVDAIRDINSSAISIGEAHVKMIQKIRLLGGTHADFRDPAGYTQVQAEGGGSSASAELSERRAEGSLSRGEEAKLEREAEKEAERAREKENEDGGRGTRAGTAVVGNQASFDPTTQFGAARQDKESEEYKRQQERQTRVASAQKTSENDLTGRAAQEEERARKMAEWLKNKGGGQEAAPELEKVEVDTEAFVSRKDNRYIDIDDTKEYVTRGFYIELTMDHRKIPDLLGNLTNMKYPTVIARVQSVSRKHNQSDFTTRAAGGGGGGGRMSRSEEDELEQQEAQDAAQTGPGRGGPAKPTTPDVDALETMVLNDPYLADVAIAGYMAIFKVETRLDDLNKEKNAPMNDGEEPGATGSQAAITPTDDRRGSGRGR